MATIAPAEYCPPTASNYVCTAHIDCHLNIDIVALMFGGRASKDVFPCCTITGRKPRLTYQVFSKGKIVVSGASNEEEGKMGLWLFVARLANSLRIAIMIKSFRVENIVAFGGIGEYFDQIEFFKDHQIAVEPPQGYLDQGPLPPIAEPIQHPRAPSKRVPPPASANKKRKRMRGSTFSEFNLQQYRGLAFFIFYPEVIIWYDTGKYVVTGTNDPKQILRIINSVDWRQYKLKLPMTIEKYRARVSALRGNLKGAAGKWGNPEFNSPKLFSNILWKAYCLLREREERKKN